MVSGSQGVIGRAEWYKAHANDFNLVFLGDSRTYCGVHSFLIDPLLGTNSINLAQFAHWLPTQYPMIQDMVKNIPSNTTVVWSIGHQNFFASSGIQRVYPVGIQHAIEYVTWGVPRQGLLDNVLYYNPLTYLVAARSEARQNLFKRFEAPVHLDIEFIKSAHAETDGIASILQSCNQVDLSCVQQAARKDPRFADASLTQENGKVNSIVFYTNRGSYFRVELDRAFFRSKQAELAPKSMAEKEANAWTIPAADPGMWRLFEEILSEFKKHGVKLVVNEIEEAPFMYSHPLVRGKYQAFMHNEVKKRVEQEGYTYISVDYDQLQADDYFDYNHLNSKGAFKYAALLSAQIKPHLKP